MSQRSRSWWIPALGVALVLAVLSGATPVACYSQEMVHEPRLEPPEALDVAPRPIVTTIWTLGAAAPAIDTLGIEPDLYLRFRRLDWSGSWWTPLWKSGALDYAVDATLFGGPAQGGAELVFEGRLHASLRGLCSPDQAREELLDDLRAYVADEIRERLGG